MHDFSARRAQESVHRVVPIRKRASREVILLVDPETGEELGWVFEGEDKPPNPKAWARLYKDSCKGIAFDKDFDAVTRIHHYLMYRLQYGNFVKETRKSIARKLGIHRNTVGRVVNLLLKKGLLQEEVSEGIRGYRVSPAFVFQGSHKDREARLALWNEKLVRKRLREEYGERA